MDGTAQQLDGERANDTSPRRRPYEPPRLRSGQAFEKVLLQSGGQCNNASIFVGCTNPCG